MGRLNYTNRKSEGLKLGQVCAKDLTKRIPGSSGSKAALRDPVVELEIHSRALTDSGLFELAHGLIQTYQANTDRYTVLRLEELHLTDNALSPPSLWHLSDVVQLAHRDLRDLDLSNNELCIKTAEHLVAWERFLRAVSRCFMLRRLDLSGNQLGSKAFEVLTRVYSQEKPIDLILPSHLSTIVELAGLNDAARSLSIGSSIDEQISSDEDAGRGSTRRGSRHVTKLPEKTSSPSYETDLLPVYATTEGLRSLPYIVLSSTVLDDTCALYLSYVIANHHQPEDLLSRVPAAKAGQPAQQLASYNTQSRCRGIIYMPNPLSNAATRVLDLAEKVRSTIPHNLAGEGPVSRAQHQVSASVHRTRTTPYLGEETQELLVADLERARSRLQTNCIENAGQACNDLWRTTLRMLTVSRVIQIQTTNNSPPTVPAPKPKQLIVRTLEIPSAPPKKANPWAMPLAPKSANASMLPRPRNRKDSTSASTHASSTTAMELPGKLCSQVGRTKGRQYKSALPCGFSEDVWSRILGYATGANGLLSAGQQRSVLCYAIDKGTLKKEREALGLKESLQIWHCLEGMDCLAYEIR